MVGKHIQNLQDFETRYSYRPDKCDKAAEYIYQVFDSNGLNASYDDFVFNHFEMRNVIGELRGTAYPDSIYIICAHYDSTGTMPWGFAPGADDNGSGTAAVLAAAELLSDYEFNHTIRFIAFSGEEQGLTGSGHYASVVKGEAQNISGVLNLDMIAYNPEPASVDVRIRHNAPSTSLANYINNVSQKYQSINSITATAVLDGTTNSDHASFWPEYEAIQFFERQFNTPHYHSSTDIIDNCNLTYSANCTQIAIASLAELAGLIGTDTSPPALSPGFPPPNGFGKPDPIISIEITDPAPLNISTMEMQVDGLQVVPNQEIIPLGLNLTYDTPLTYPDGAIVNVSIFVEDIHGNGINYSWVFMIDGIAPQPPSNPAISVTRIEAVKQGLVIDSNTTGVDDRYAWAPSVIFHDNEYKMWYSARSQTNFHIAYANSTDGLNWNKYGVVIAQGTSGEPDSGRALYPTVIFDNGEYTMWYSAYDSSHYRIMYANSTDGLSWTKQSIVLDNGGISQYDTYNAYMPSVIKTNEYEMWYTGTNGRGDWLLYANSTDGINWNKWPEPVMTKESDLRYSKGRICFSTVAYDGEYHMWYSGFDGSRHRTLYANSSNGIYWERLGLAVNTGINGENDFLQAMWCSAIITPNETKLWYSGYAGDGKYRILYANISMADYQTGLEVNWAPSTSTDILHYEICRANSLSGLTPWVTYLIMNDTAFVENGIGDEDDNNYYYRIRSVDKVGQYSECPQIVGKIGNNAAQGWNLVGNPFIEGNSTLAGPLSTVDWNAAMIYDIYDPAHPWKSNHTDRPPQLNTLGYVNQTTGIWINVVAPESYTSTGTVTNISIYLLEGWNLVAYPHHDVKIVSQALTGLPYDIVERFNPAAPYYISTMGATDPMYPGYSYWIHMTSAAVWFAVNEL
ncbi:MAG: hypothetical protein AYK23_00155 [Candidatus Proteinoplasmatales archaeon SG8-5]|nr:MAG: hypothetical protein AYK23_00155 [Candidatus Proteinoplasmatales archaeon SG8-5]